MIQRQSLSNNHLISYVLLQYKFNAYNARRARNSQATQQHRIQANAKT